MMLEWETLISNVVSNEEVVKDNDDTTETLLRSVDEEPKPGG